MTAFEAEVRPNQSPPPTGQSVSPPDSGGACRWEGSGNSPLNPPLFTALEREFGDVHIANPGQIATGDTSGEYYRVNCPHCGDAKQRLWVNYRFNSDDGQEGDNLHLVNCFNERCIKSRQSQLELRDRLFPFSYGLPISGVGPPATESPPMETPASPQTESGELWGPPVVPLDSPEAERGRQYLENRNFDPEEISELWEVRYCSIYMEPPIELSNCLVIPVESCQFPLGSSKPEFDLAGWQARNLSPSSTEPKYYTMPGLRVKQHLYGIMEAVDGEEPLVVVEGVTDVWRLGPGAVATFGKSMGRQQQELLIRIAGDRPIVVIYDRDASAEGNSMANSLRQLRRDHALNGRVVAAPPPDGCNDVGEATREAAWAQVENALKTETLGGTRQPVVAAPGIDSNKPENSNEAWEIVL